MPRRPQQRTLETRANLLACARASVLKVGYAGLRVDDVVTRAGVAKGTFFAHFKDKDGILECLVGDEMDRLLAEMERLPPPTSVADLADCIWPFLLFLRQDRYTFDFIIRHSGATASDQIGPIAQAFHRHAAISRVWMDQGRFRVDVPPAILAHGIQAFMIHSVGLEFCALHSGDGLRARLCEYLEAWLNVPG
ncbi:TetR/AcrR family transcriptional regulator [Tateyamaria omphalii]|uniref:TetR/AcrR family transcriptional regulator n=1 Tax=Tateyamaria omphalii TaxID=299262 RepID=UPI00167B4A49|nr:TetR/AcrR family transcriptional regulator [Tateyamaria omphalii]